MSNVSDRGLIASQTVLRVDMDISMEAQDNQYHAVENPDGTFPLNIAENRLCWPELKAKFHDISRQKDIPDWVMGYTSPLGDPVFANAIAGFYQRNLFNGMEVDPNHFACSPGATGIIEMSAFILANKGDVAAFPAPCYPVYRQDIGNISGIDRYDIVTHDKLSELQDGPPLNIGHLERTKTDIEASGKTFKLLVLTTPDNPTGQVYGHQQLSDIASWCIANKVHLIINEIYALSRINTDHPTISDDYRSGWKSAEIGKILQSHRSDYIHHWYSLSKDFGISGFRVGIVYSTNETFLQAYINLNLTHSVSNHTQWLISELVDDQAFIEQYIATNQERLTTSYALVIATLKALEIPYVAARGSLFVWVDLLQYLEADTINAEEQFWMELYHATGVLLTPGHGFGHKGYGKFRFVYPYVSPADLKVGLGKFERWLRGL